MATRLLDVTIIALLLFCTTQAAMKINLNHILAHQQHQSPHQLFHKRNHHINRPDDDNTDNKLAGAYCCACVCIVYNKFYALRAFVDVCDSWHWT